MTRPPSGETLRARALGSIARALGTATVVPLFALHLAAPAHAQDDDILVPEDAPTEAAPAEAAPSADESVRRLDAGTVEQLALALAQNGSFKVRATAAVALGRLGDPRGLHALTSALTTDPHYAVRAAAASALGRVKHPDSVKALLRALRDPDPMVRSQAKDALGSFHTAAHVDAFESATRSNDARERRAAISAYGDVLRAGHDPAAPIVLNALGDDDEEVRVIAERALSALGHERRLPLLLQGLGDANAPVRSTSARLVARSADERAVPALLAALQRTEETEDVRAALRDAIRAHREYVQVGAVLARAGDVSLGASPERLDAISLSGAFGGRAAERVLAQALSDENPQVRGTAARACVDLGRERAKALLEPALANEREPRVKRQIEIVLRTLR